MPDDVATAPVRVRRAAEGDREAIVALAGRALGWRDDEPNGQLFSWKHDASPFGPSPTWVAEVADSIVGIRVFLRWQFVDPTGAVVRAVRAVDTATDPGHQGRGIFRKLTLAAIDELEAEGAAFVFNTPNDQSRPGYLKMGWEVLGRVPVAVAVRSPVGAVRMLRARVPAGKWSLPSDAGEPAGQVFGPDAPAPDRGALASVLEAARPAGRLTTHRTPSFFDWRYAGGPLDYRVIRRGRHLDDGFVVFRVRARGVAREATICDVVHPDTDPRIVAELVRTVLADTGADYAIAVERHRVTRAPSVQLPGQGPVFTWRSLGSRTPVPLADWSLRLGDIELF